MLNEQQIEAQFKNIQQRNKRVETDKAWEVSLTRRIFIAAVTYIIASIWLLTINDTTPFLKALVPAGGYIMSTLSLPFIKNWWVARFIQRPPEDRFA